MMPVQAFEYPNGKHGVYVYKSGYQSTSMLFGQAGITRCAYGTKYVLDSDEGRSEVFLPVRHPVERFASGINTVRKNKKYADYSVDTFIEMLENNTFRNLHFMDIYTVLRNLCFSFDDIRLYRFPDHYEQMLRDGGYEGEIPHENKSTKKLILTDSQTARVADYYENDMKLFNSIEQAGQKFLLPFA